MSNIEDAMSHHVDITRPVTMAIRNSTDPSKAEKQEGELSNREEIEADGHDENSENKDAEQPSFWKKLQKIKKKRVKVMQDTNGVGDHAFNEKKQNKNKSKEWRYISDIYKVRYIVLFASRTNGFLEQNINWHGRHHSVAFMSCYERHFQHLLCTHRTVCGNVH